MADRRPRKTTRRGARADDSWSLPQLVPLGRWADRGACRALPPELADRLFFPPPGDHSGEAYARAICGRCEVRDLCLGAALACGRDLEGVWGGTSARQRRALRSRRRRLGGSGTLAGSTPAVA